jgi:acetylornithine deacetylase/succinyl-diaminopimelate desuccinylase-like protein
MKALLLLALAAAAHAQTDPAAKAARQWRETHERAIVSEFIELLSLPNLARDTAAIRKNADAIVALLQRRGVKTRLLEAPGAPPIVYGEIATPGATRTIVFYAHYDGQPLDPKEWASPPWTPTLRDAPLDKDGRVIALPAGKFDPEWRLYARSSGDDKTPLKAAGIAHRSHIKFVFEGEEEGGSPHLAHFLAANKDLLRGDVWLICDGPVHQSRRQQIVFGARGIVTIDITLYGPNRELHSGHYGNWAPNPAMALARLLASMKDDDGRVTIANFYDGIEPLTDIEKRAIAASPDVDAGLRRELALGRTEGAGRKLVELINYPSLNIRGMSSARTGAGASNVLPSSATASIDIRLVKGIAPQTAVKRVLDHIRAQGYTIVENEPDAQTRIATPKLARVVVESGGYPALRTSMDLPISQLVLKTAEAARGPIVKLPTMGGSVPLFMIDEQLRVPTILVPIANHDNNQHSFNENIRLQNLWDGIELMAALLAM